jgi:tetratricopeptide (TPR) repeat protein
MDYRELQGDVMAAYGQHDYDGCFSILDSFMASATGEDLGRALSLKAEVISGIDCRRNAEALALVDESLCHVHKHPAATLSSFVLALYLCNVTGDVARAGSYEVRGHRLLQEHGADPGVTAIRFRFYANLGSLARTRGDYATAYWNFMQAIKCLDAASAAGGSNLKTSLYWLYLQTGNACLNMGRVPEAAEALDKAEELAVSEQLRIRLAVARGQFLRASGHPHQAARLLEQLCTRQPDTWPPETLTLYYLAKAQTAQDLSDLRGFHYGLAAAQRVALEHSLDYLLCEIQRVQRAPVSD